MELRTIANVALRLGEWQSLQELAPAAQRLLDHVISLFAEEVKQRRVAETTIDLTREIFHLCENWLSSNHASTAMPPFLTSLVSLLRAVFFNSAQPGGVLGGIDLWGSEIPSVHALLDLALSCANWLPIAEQQEDRRKMFLKCLSDPRPSVVRSALSQLSFCIQRNGPKLFFDILAPLKSLATRGEPSLSDAVLECVGQVACLFSQSPQAPLDTFTTSRPLAGAALQCIPYCSACISRESIAAPAPLAAAISHRFALPLDGPLYAKAPPRSLHNVHCSMFQFLSSGADETVGRSLVWAVGRLLQHAGLTADESLAHLRTLSATFLETSDEPTRMASLGAILSLLRRADIVDSQYLYSSLMAIKPIADILRHPSKPLGSRLLALRACAAFASFFVDEHGLDVFLQCILETLVDPSVDLRGASLAALHRICEAKKISLKELISSRKENIVYHLVQTLRSSPLLDAVTALIETTTSKFLQEHLEVILPKLVHSNSRDVIAEVARRLGESPQALVTKNLNIILPVCFLEGLNKDVSNYLQGIVQSDLTNELVQFRVPIVKLLSFHLGDANRDVATKALDTLQKSSIYLVPKDMTDRKKALEDLLKSAFLELLDDFYRLKLSSPRTELATKRQAIRAIGELVKLLEPIHLRSFYIKIIAILKAVMASIELREGAAAVWLILLTKLDPGVFDGPLLSDLVVHFTSYLGESEEHVLPLFRYLFIDARSYFERFYQDIPFMPDKPSSLDDCIRAYKSATRSSKDPREQLASQLSRLGRVITHENFYVRMAALEKLLSLFRSDSGILPGLITSDSVDDTLRTIIYCALAGCTDSHPPARVLFATLLGEIGAIDPARLEKTATPGSTSTAQSGSSLIEATELKITSQIIVRHLIKLFKSAATPHLQDVASFAIQELLKSQFCYELDLNGRSHRTKDEAEKATTFWNAVVAEERLLLEPFRTSNFFSDIDFAEKVRAVPLSIPLYGRARPTKYESWLADWTIRLVLCLEDPTSFYHCVLGVVRHDRELCQSLIPHLVIKILLSGSNKTAIGALRDEFVAVLSQAPAQEFRELQQQATERIFSVFDGLSLFVEKTVSDERSRTSVRSTDSKRAPPSAAAPVSSFLDTLKPTMLCEAALRQKNYTRALQHFEIMVHASPDISSFLHAHPESLKLLQKIYVGLDEPDLLSGIATLHPRASFDDRLLQYESAGRWVDSLNVVDQSLQFSSLDDDTVRQRHLYRLRCLINLNLYDSALSLVKADLADKLRYSESHAQLLRTYGVNAARRLGKWQLVDEFLNEGSQPGYDLSIAQILLSLKHKDEAQFKKQLMHSRLEQMSQLAATVSESYSRSYPIVARLHMLSELEKSWSTLVATPGLNSGPAVQAMLRQWDDRFALVQPSFRITEPILSLRMEICDIAEISGPDVDKAWLRVAKLARMDRKFNLSHYALLRINNQESATIRVERAELEMAAGQPSDAVAEVGRVLDGIETGDDRIQCIANFGDPDRCQHNFSPPEDPEERQAWGEAILFTLRSISGSGDAMRVSTLLHALTTTLSSFGEGHLAMARFLDRYLSETSKQNFDFNRPISGVPASRILVKTLHSYVNALQHGPQFIYQVGPRLMTLWLDFTEKISAIPPEQGGKHQFVVELSEIKRIMMSAVAILSPGMWYTVLPQIISRVTHPDSSTWDILLRIIAEKLLENYPRHVPWHLIAWSKGSVQRQDRYAKLRQFVGALDKQGGSGISKVLDQAERLGEFLLDVAMYDVEERGTVKPPTTKWIVSLSRIMERLAAAPTRAKVPRKKQPLKLQDLVFDLVVPVESELFHLPIANTPHDSASGAVTIRSFGDDIEVMKSMVKPRRIEMIGSNGITYSFLAKPKDDLRKDARVTDFNNVVNYLLKQDSEGRRRQLIIRTYGVVVLNPECGLLSWVPNTHPMRHLTSDQYEAVGRPVKVIAHHFKTKYYDAKDKTEDTWKLLMAKFARPSRFWRWFVVSYSDPSSWYRARLCYTRTAAVMSMVGHILGLGDRHGENILIDARNGDCVHVDLNCVFHKGQTFAVPERVPFRLTHNMVDAMGVSGYNGTFRTVSELTMAVLRKNKETLLSVLNTLLHDPLLDWSAKSSKSAEPPNPEALGNAALAAVGDRLDGIKRDNITKADLLLPMSVESLVESLIRDATSDTNLREMYLGWMAYI